MTNSDPLLRKAKKKVKQKKAFYQHFMTMGAVSIFLVLFSFFVTPNNYLWVIIALLGMGLSVLLHFITVFGIPGVGNMGEDWEERELEKEYLRLKRLEDIKDILSDKEYLELKELEKKERNGDFV